MLTRRKTLLRLLLAILGTAYPPFVKIAIGKTAYDKEKFVKCLYAMIDKIIPASTAGGGAIAGGVPQIVFKKLTEDTSRQNEIFSALEALNREAAHRFDRKDFCNLTTNQQVEVLKEFASGNFTSAFIDAASAKKTFAWIRKMAIEKYYSDPATFRAIGFSGPSQYRGHPDYDRWPQT